MIVLALGCCGIANLIKRAVCDDNIDRLPVNVILSLILMILFGMVSYKVWEDTSWVWWSHNNIKMQTRDKEIRIKYYNEVKSIVREKLLKYPMEKEIIDNLDPKILLKLPEIKSDKLLITMIEKLEAYMNEITKTELQITTSKARLDKHKSRLRSLTLISPYYEDEE
jgi:hypothetical protein